MDTYKSEIVRNIADSLSVPVQDGVIKQINPTISPVFIANEKGDIRKLTVVSTAVGATYLGSITVPTGKIWEILYGVITWVSDATAGNRTPRIQVQMPSGSTVLWYAQSGNQAASTTGQYILSPTAIEPSNTISSTYHYMPTPRRFIIPAGASLVITDPANISQSDTTSFQLLIREYSSQGVWQ